MDEPAVNGIRRERWGQAGGGSDSALGPLSLDRMGPILRDLVAFGLVVRTETGRFELRAEVQRWLAERLGPLGPSGHGRGVRGSPVPALRRHAG